jgi:hypothetical protein
MLEVMLLTSNGSNPKAVITARMGARKLLVIDMDGESVQP